MTENQYYTLQNKFEHIARNNGIHCSCTGHRENWENAVYACRSILHTRYITQQEEKRMSKEEYQYLQTCLDNKLQQSKFKVTHPKYKTTWEEAVQACKSALHTFYINKK